jgi:hypothetical protein
MAALIVQRPSPESDTRPPKRARDGSSHRALAVRSSSHEAITLPRRHNLLSGICCRLRPASPGTLRSLALCIAYTVASGSVMHCATRIWCLVRRCRPLSSCCARPLLRVGPRSTR